MRADIDECAAGQAGCGVHGTCDGHNPPGSYTCTCDSGYSIKAGGTECTGNSGYMTHSHGSARVL